MQRVLNQLLLVEDFLDLWKAFHNMTNSVETSIALHFLCKQLLYVCFCKTLKCQSNQSLLFEVVLVASIMVVLCLFVGALTVTKWWKSSFLSNKTCPILCLVPKTHSTGVFFRYIWWDEELQRMDTSLEKKLPTLNAQGASSFFEKVGMIGKT